MKPSDLLALARERMADAYSAEIDHRERAEDDLRMVTGDQWPEEERLEAFRKVRDEIIFNIFNFHFTF